MKKCVNLVLSFVLVLVLLAGTGGSLARTHAQEGDCGDAPPPRLIVDGRGMVSYTDGRPLNVRDMVGLSGTTIAQLPEGSMFLVQSGPFCSDNMYWWEIVAGSSTSGFIAEGAEGQYFVEPYTVSLASGTGPFTAWDWGIFVGSGWGSGLPDPMAITPPPVYAGDLPSLPVDLTNVQFINDASLTDAQKTLLMQNGFVVVPAGLKQFDDAYAEDEIWWTVPADYNWEANPPTQQNGHAYFVTTDAMLHSLHYVFDNLLTDLEKGSFYPTLSQQVLIPALQAAHAQTQQAAGTPLETPARSAELYLAVAVELFAPGEIDAIVSPDMVTDVRSIAQMAIDATGQLELPLLPGYVEDFSQYRPRGHYAGDPQLENYFRGMMWTSRITFLSNSDDTTLIALLLLRALETAPGAVEGWRNVHDILTFLIGPIDDLGPVEYAPLADQIFGTGLPLDKLADSSLLANFRAEVEKLPPPRINGMVLPQDTTPGNVAQRTRGFRFMGQRFTFDAYAMQQLMNPYVVNRMLPMGLDVPATMGSEIAYNLAVQSGAAQFQNYDSQIAKLRDDLGALTDANWLENTYGGWLWALKPLWVRDSALYPPMMQTEAWLRKDIQTGLASWTELKHDTVLYVKQPTGFGGGGPPLTSFGYVEPNPLVFARIAVIAAMTYEGLLEHGVSPSQGWSDDPNQASLDASLGELRSVAIDAADFAEIARKELAGEPLTDDDYWAIFGFGGYLSTQLRTLYQGEGEPPPVALVTDVANNPDIGAVLQEGVGNVDYIYVVVPSPSGGYQLVRGGVFSYYEFTGDINQRMTDQEWRDKVASGDLPPRPDWINAFYSAQ